jgi:hypothetical protein
MTLATEIRDACLLLPKLDHGNRYGLIQRILRQLQAYRRTALHGVPPERRFWIETLIDCIGASMDEIADMESAELLQILVEFEKLIGVLDEIAMSKTAIFALH